MITRIQSSFKDSRFLINKEFHIQTQKKINENS
jgi:hypothetical protein